MKLKNVHNGYVKVLQIEITKMEKKNNTLKNIKKSDKFWKEIKNGYILCLLLQEIDVKLLDGYKPKNNKNKVSNIKNIKHFIKGCIKIGVPKTELFQEYDLYNNKPNKEQILRCLYALSARSRNIGYHEYIKSDKRKRKTKPINAGSIKSFENQLFSYQK